MATLPAGVTLRQIDGGANYYANNGFTYAVNAGWDDPSFFSIGPWLAPMVTQSDASRWLDLNWNTAFGLTGNSNLGLLRSNGIYGVLQPGEAFAPSFGAETVGLLTADEGGLAATQTTIGTTANSIQDHRYWWINNTWNFLEYGDLSGVPASQVLSMPFATPNGTTRHIDIQSVDIYWFASANTSQGLGQLNLYAGGLMYNLGRNMTPDEVRRGSNYGDMIDRERAFQGTYPAPIAAYIETGGPYGEDTTARSYITPPELNWAVWSSIIHGARQVIYFNHSFAGPAPSPDNLRDPYYQTIQPGQTISMYDQVKATDALVEQLAPVLNSPFALNYVTPNGIHYSFGNPISTFGGIEVMTKYYNDTFYIFADTRYSETQTNIPATFTINDPNATSVTVVNENRIIPVTNGVFTDTFASAWTVHIYEVSYDFSGGSGNDTLTGNNAANFLSGNDGSDVVVGSLGNDTLVGGFGADTLLGNQDDDVILGNQDDDVVVGGRGADVVVGGQGFDLLLGNEANDLVFGNESNDTIVAGRGADTIVAGQGDDDILGSEDNDFMLGNEGTDRFIFFAGSGTDIIGDFSGSQGDRLVLSGQTYVQGTSSDGDVLLTLSGGGTIELNGVGAAGFSPSFVV